MKNIHQIVLPINLEIIIPKDDSVRLLYEVTEGLNYKKLYRSYSILGRNSAIDPKTLFRIVVYGYMERIFSSRELEKACIRDVNFRWLLQGQKASSHNTIVRFKSSRMKYCLEDLFNQLVLKLNEKDEIKLLKEKTNLEFVYGKGKRKSKLQKYAEGLEDFIEKQSKYDNYNEIFNGRNSFSKTDKDATFMHMKEDHMKNGQLKPGYNIQIGVEGEYIVGVDVSSERSDQLTLIPFLDKLKSNLSTQYKSVTADAGYESEENYLYLENNNYEAYIKPQNYEKSKTKKFKKNIGNKENMTYLKDEDCYICANSQRLTVKSVTTKKSKSGYKSEITIYESESCEGCKYKSSCTKAKGNKKITTSKKFAHLREKSLENIKTDKGILLRKNRSIQVEGAFGVIKQDYGFRRFLMRGTKNVITKFLLIAFGYNINKLHRKTLEKRNGQLLHLKNIA
ncbi:IS1182 family transposase [Clostridium perfringens]|uniref:transposase n=3 Tax=Clostridium perfringens TaxID=1502 RepID=UPI0006686A5E|nr:transposase [Clostridium perfringens]MBX9099212.1 transposase [Clostridium perfringens]MDB2040330.1 IS1182 family transposase [Clostridium perfringens]MDB2047951.1 IS1182 family transposase [Clostridium perfringens]MDK0637319.1 IS1182 family transposase [Clostridium perfringens]MDK0725315.1 IS1182 family transposase [Clostridium perfringens]